MLWDGQNILSAGDAIDALRKLYAEWNSNSNKAEILNDMKSALPIMAKKLHSYDSSGEWRLPRIKGTWNGEKGNSNFTPDDDLMPLTNDAGYNPKGLTLKRIMKERGNGQTLIRYVNRLADFRPLARDNYEFKASQELLSDRDNYQAEARKFIAQKKGMSAEQVIDYLDKYKLTIHEWPDGRGFSLVDFSIHESFAHTGGVSFAQFCMEGGRPITRQDVIETRKFLDRYN